MNETVHILQRLGFGDYEARAYMALLQRSPMTGYELAKLSGIPRANVYDVLPRLEERGAVVRVDSPSGARYSAVPPSEFMPRLADRFNDDLVAAEEALAEAPGTADQEYAWNVESRRSVIDHARTLIDSAQRQVMLGVLPEEAALLSGNVARAQERGVAITTLCLAACSPECGGCRGKIFGYRFSPQDASRWLVVVVDGRELLAGHIGAGEVASAVRTNQQLLVELAGSYVLNSVALATLVSDLGDRLGGVLSPEAMSVLSSLGPDNLPGGWLDHISEVLRRSSVARPGEYAPEHDRGKEEPAKQR